MHELTHYLRDRFNYPHIGVFLLALLAADLLTPLVIRLAFRIRAVDRPHSYKIHRSPVPFLGGVAIYAAFATGLFTLFRFPDLRSKIEVFGILGGGLFVLVLGLIDGYRPISAVYKLLLIIGVTALLSNEPFNIHLTLFGGEANAANFVLTVLWIAGVTSAANSLDNMDGACSGTAMIAALSIFAIAWTSVQEQLSYMAAGLFGATLGFLRYNFLQRPARIFLGDNGSFLLGFLLAAMTVQGTWAQEDPLKGILVPCSILCVPLYDITLSTWLRWRNGVVKGIREAILYCGRDHLAHRLTAIGFGPRQAVCVLYAMGFGGGAVAFVIAQPGVGPGIYLPIVGLSVLLLVILGAILNRAPVYRDREKWEPKGKPEDGRP